VNIFAAHPAEIADILMTHQEGGTMGDTPKHMRALAVLLSLSLLPISTVLGANAITNNAIGDFWHDSSASEDQGYIVWHTCPDSYLLSTVDFYDAFGGLLQSIPGSEGSGAPSISGSLVTWEQWVDESTRDIFWCDLQDPGLTIHPACDDCNPGDDVAPVMDDTLIAWVGEGPLGDYEVWYASIASGYSGYFPNPDHFDNRPRVDAPCLVWYGWDGDDYEIAFFDTELFAGYQITDNEYDDVNPEISGSMVMWEGWDGEDWEIFVFDTQNPGMGIIQVTNNSWDDQGCDIESTVPGLVNATWYAYDGEDWEIWVAYDLPLVINPIQLSNNALNDYNPRISGLDVVWYGYDGEDWEIFYFNGTNGISGQLTYNTLWDQNPSLHGNRLVWECYDGEDYEICSAILNTTASEDPGAETSISFGLGAWNPNPMQSNSAISFALPHSARVEVDIFDLAGKRVASLTRGTYAAGRHMLTWDGKDHAGRSVSAGVYFCQLKAEGNVSTKRLTVLK
jgi:hypothetical protein